ncbi:protein DpdD [Verrucomicrobia bacterium]|nr:protein DpdD [Verrucomicrobiota bacterium]
MNLIKWNRDDICKLGEFYSDGCKWTIDEMNKRSSAPSRSACDWVESSLPPRQYPLILPRVTHSGDAYWYAIAFNEAQAEQLREDLIAFIGSVGTDYDGRRFPLNKADDSELVLFNWVGGSWVFRLTLSYPRLKGEVRQSLDRMRSIWRLKPPLSSSLLRTTEALIRELYLSFGNGNESNADYILQELRESGRLSAENIVFLEIKKLASFGRWGAIAAHSQLSYMTRMPRPRQITKLLLEALWNTELSSYADAEDVDGIIKYYKSTFVTHYRNLIKSYRDSVNEPVILTFLLASVGDEPPRIEQIPKLLERLVGSKHLKFAEALASRVNLSSTSRQTDVSSLNEIAKHALVNYDFDTAWEKLLLVDPSVESVRAMLECMFEFETQDAARIVKQRFELLSQSSQLSVLKIKRHQSAWELVGKLTTNVCKKPPSNWNDWFMVVNSGNFDSDCLLKIARDESSEWDEKIYFDSPEKICELAAFISECPQTSQYILSLSIPHLLAFFMRDGIGAREYLSIYSALIEILILSDSFSSEDWNTTESLLNAMLQAGLSDFQYADLLKNLSDHWVFKGGVVHFDWALDVLDLFTMYAVQEPESLEKFYSVVAAKIAEHSRKVRRNQWEIFKLLSDDLNFSSTFQAIVPEHYFQSPKLEHEIDLSGKIIAIYTLTESAGKRAATVIKKIFPNAKIRLSNDSVGSNKLKALARDSDYFVVSTRSAKHAATNFIKDNRSKQRTKLIYPSGKGSSSIVSSLLGEI